MNRIATRSILVFLCSFAFLLISLPASAQDAENLLTNPGFEDPFVEFDGNPPRLVAEGWTPYHTEAAATDPGYQNQQPEYYPAASEATDATNRIHGGANAQLYLTFFATHYGGFYQVVEGVNPGDVLEFSAYVYVWSTTFDDVNESREDGDVFVAVGIDPTGGTDPASEAIVWSDEIEAYDAYNQISVSTTAASDSVSVWVWSTVGFPVMNNNIYVDDASLIVVEGGAEVTEVPVATEEATEAVETEEATEVVETEEATEAVETEEATEVVETEEATEAVETEEVPVETEAVVTEEATEAVETEAVETEETGPSDFNLTATAIVLGVTQTAEAIESVETEAVTEEAEVDDLGLTATAIIAGVTQTADAEDNATFTPTSTPIPPTATSTNTATATDVPPTNTSTPVPATNTRQPSPTAEVIIATTSLDTETPVNTSTPTGPTAVPTLLSDVFPFTITHIVQADEIVAEIAERYGSTVDAIIEANELGPDALIFINQELIVPVSQPGLPTLAVSQTPIVIIVTATPLPATVPAIEFTDVIEYTIQPGDTLFVLAERFNTDLNMLSQLNGIVNPNRIQVGQIIIIPLTPDSVIGLTPPPTSTSLPPTATHTVTPVPPTGVPTLPPPSPVLTSVPTLVVPTIVPSATPTHTPDPANIQTIYVVQPGDSLYRISLLFGVSLADLIEANNLPNPDRIFRGQSIIIPFPSLDGDGDGVAPGDATALPPEMRPLAIQGQGQAPAGQAQVAPATTTESRG